MSCIAPRCASPAVVGSVFCKKCLRAPATQRGGWLSAARRRDEMKVDASNISKNLWVGAAPPFDRDLPKIDTLVLCAKEIQPATTAFHGSVVRCPIDDADLTSNELAMVLMAAKRVAADLLQHRTVLVTCAQGRNRSAMVAALALGQITRRSSAQIVDLIRARRRRDCLSNPTFVQVIERFVKADRAEVHSARGTTRVVRRG